jgi:hypothetical protein
MVRIVDGHIEKVLVSLSNTMHDARDIHACDLAHQPFKVPALDRPVSDRGFELTSQSIQTRGS